MKKSASNRLALATALICQTASKASSPKFHGNRAFARIVGGLAVLCCATPWAQPRIIDGEPATPWVFPWVVAVNVGTTKCTGTLLASQWVMTAGHCFTDYSGRRIDENTFSLTSVFPMAADGSRDTARAQIPDQVWIHPDYDPDFVRSLTADNADLTLLHLPNPLDTTPILGILRQDPPVGSAAWVLGWGATQVIGGRSTNHASTLRHAPQTVVDQATCQEIYPEQLTDNMICANGTPTRPSADSCAGDSGGPLVVATSAGYWLVGVVSFGGTDDSLLCGDPDVPGVYTRLNRFLPFIQLYAPETGIGDWQAVAASCAAEADSVTLDVVLPCLQVENTRIATRLHYQTETGYWQWPGSLRLSDCELCASLGEDWRLDIPDLRWQNHALRAQLEFLPPRDWRLETLTPVESVNHE